MNQTALDGLWERFEDEPASDAAFMDLVQALDPQREHEQLVDLYRQRAEAVDTEQAVYLYLTVADVWSQRLGMPGLATEALFSAYERDPQNEVIKNRLWLHLEHEQDWNTFARFLSTELRMREDIEGRCFMRLAFGHLLQRRLHDVAEAARMFRDAAQHPPLRGAALLALMRLQRQESAQTLDLVSTIDNVRVYLEVTEAQDEAQVLAMDAGEAKAKALIKLAKQAVMQADRLDRLAGWLGQAVGMWAEAAAEARGLLETVLFAVPEHGDALKLLLSWEGQPGMGEVGDVRWRALGQILRMGPLLVEDLAARAVLLMLVGAFEAAYLGVPEQAARTYIAAVGLSANVTADVRKALSALLERSPQLKAVREALLGLLTASGQPSGAQLEQWQALADQAQRTSVPNNGPPPPPSNAPPPPPPPSDRAKTQQQPRLTLPPPVAPITKPVLAVSGSMPAITKADINTVSGVITAVVPAISDPSAEGNVEEVLNQLRDPKANIKRGGDLHVQAQALSAAGHHDALEVLLKRQIDTFKGPDRAQAQAEWAELLAGPLGRVKDAVAVYEQALTQSPQSHAHATRLRQILTNLGDIVNAKRWIATELRLVANPAERCHVLIARAKLEAQSGETAAALLTLAEVFLLRPAHPIALAQLHDLLTHAPASLQALLAQNVPPLSVGPQAQRLRALGLALQAWPAHRSQGMDCLHKAFKLAAAQFKELDALPSLFMAAGRSDLAAEVNQWLSRQVAKPRPAAPVLATDLSLLPFFNQPNADTLKHLCDHLRQSLSLLALADVLVWSAQNADWLDLPTRQAHLAQARTLYQENGATSEPLPNLPTAPQAPPAPPSATTSTDVTVRAFNPSAVTFDATDDDTRWRVLEQVVAWFSTDARWSALAAWLQDALTRTDQPAWRQALLRRIAEVQAEHLGDLTQARRITKRLLDEDPQHPHTLILLMEIEHRAGSVSVDPRIVRQLISLDLSAMPTGLLFRLAKLQRVVFNDRDESLRTAQTLLARVDSAQAPASLDRLAVFMLDNTAPDYGEQLDAWLGMLDMLIQQTPPPPAATYFAKVRARLLDSELGPHPRTWNAWSGLLRLDPGSSEAQQALARFQRPASPPPPPSSPPSQPPSDLASQQRRLEDAIARDPLDETSLVALDRLYRQQNLPDKLIEILARRAALSTDDAARLAMLSERAQILDRSLNDPSAAIAALQQVLASFPTHVPSLTALGDLYRRIGRFEELIDVLSALMQAQPDQRFVLALEVAALLEINLNRPDDAFTQYRWAHELNLEDERPGNSLWRLAKQHNLWAELIEFLEFELSRKTDPAHQLQSLDELAEVTEHQLHDPVRAFHMRHMAWQLDHQSPTRFDALTKLAEGAQLWPELATLFRSQAASYPEGSPLQLQYLDRLASLTAHELDDPAAAFEILGEAMLAAADPAERLSQLHAFAQEHNLWGPLFDVLLEKFEQNTGDLTEQQRLLFECAQIAGEHLRDPSHATALAIDAWILAPTDTDALIQQLSRWQPNTHTLIEQLFGIASKLEANPNNESHLIHAARLRALTLEHLLQDPAAAMRVLCEALDQIPHSPLLTSLLLSIANRHGLMPELIRTADSRIKQAPSSSLWLNVKANAEAQTSPALHLSLQSASPAPAPSAVLRRVSRPSTGALSGAGVKVDVIQRLRALDQALQNAQTSPERIDLALQLSQALSDDASRSDAALDLLVRVNEQHPNEPRIQWALSSLLIKAHNYTDALPLLRALHESSPPSLPATWLRAGESPTDPISLLIAARYARCLERDGSQTSTALALYQSLVNEHPNNILLIAGLGRCSHQTGNWDKARAILEDLLSGPAQPVLESDELSELYFALGDIFHAARQIDDARSAFELSLSFDPDFRPAADQMLAILIEQRRWPDTIDAFDRLLRLTNDPDEQGAIFKRLGEVYEYFLSDHDKAIAAYEQALAFGGDTDDVPPRLLRLYVKHAEWEKARIIAEILLERAPRGTSLRVEILLVLGDILHQGLSLSGPALDVYQQALGLDPENLLALDRAASVMIKQRNIGAVHGLYQQFLKRLDPKDPKKRVEVLARYGKQLLVMGESPERGLEIFKGLADLVPNDVDVHTQLFNIFSGQGMHNPAAELVHLRKLVSLKQIRFEYIQHIAELYEQLNEREGAAEVRTLLALACGQHPPVRSTPATPRLEFDKNALTGDNYEYLIADPYVVGPLSRFFDRLYKLGLGELGQQVEFSGMVSVAELTRLSSTPASERFNRLCESMNLGKRRLFIRSDLGQQYQVLASSPPAIALGEQLVQDRSEDEWRFILARTLELSRPRFLLSSSLGAFSFVTVLRTLLHELSSDRRDVPVSLVDPEAEERVMRFLNELRASKSIEVQEDLQSIVDQIFSASGDEGPSAKRYAQAARATSVRMGLLVCNDQRIALDYLMREDHGKGIELITDFDTFAGFVERSPDLHALVCYVISEEYLLARRALNLPRTQLSNIIQLPPNLQSRSNISVLPTSGEIRIADPQNIPISKSVSDAFSMDSGVNSLFGDEINDLIDALPIDEMIPSSPRPSFDRVGTDASSRALEDAVGQQRSATPPPPKRRR